MTRAQISQKLEEAMDRLDSECRECGHKPHPWVYDEVNRSHTACRACGRTMVVRVYPDHVFTSGLTSKCSAPPRY